MLLIIVVFDLTSAGTIATIYNKLEPKIGMTRSEMALGELFWQNMKGIKASQALVMAIATVFKPTIEAQISLIM